MEFTTREPRQTNSEPDRKDRIQATEKIETAYKSMIETMGYSGRLPEDQILLIWICNHNKDSGIDY